MRKTGQFIIIIFIIIINIFFISFFSRPPAQSLQAKKLVIMGVATVVHSVGNVPKKETTFPLCKAKDRR